MPRNGSGLYSLPEAPFTPGTVISSTAMNADLTDIALALTDSIAADGQTPITGSFKISDGTAALPSYSFITGTSDGMHHPGAGSVAFSVLATDTLTIQAPSATVGGGLTGVSGSVLNPIGVVADFAGTTAPTGWFFCYGQLVSRTTYAELFTVLGTAWGAGDGLTTFGLPDYRGRYGAGKDDMGGSAAGRITNAVSGIVGTTLGASGGAQSHQLTTTECPTGLITYAFTDPQHAHTVPFSLSSQNFGINNGPCVLAGSTATSTNSTGITSSITDHGGNGAHAQIPPANIVNKMIFAGHP